MLDAYRLARAKVEKQRDQYWEDKMEQEEWNDDDLDFFTRLVADTLEAHFWEDSSKEWSAFDIAALRSSVSSEFGSENVAMLAQKYKAILRPQSVDAVKREYDDFKRMVKEKVEQGTISSFSDVVAATLGCQELSEVAQLVDICGTFQGTTAACDRGFELMNEIKNTSETSIKVEHLEQLIRIKSRHGDLDTVYNHWRSEKDSQGT